MSFFKTVTTQVFDREKFRLARKRKKITQRALSEAVGCSPAFLCDVEKGYRKPSEEMALRLIAALERK